MSDITSNKAAHSSPSDIINTFNTFFTNLPTNKSFDMTYKVYIRDMADTEDRTSLSATNSLINLQGSQPITIASHGIVPMLSVSSTRLDQTSIGSAPTSKSSSTNLKTEKAETPKSVTMTQIDRLCADNLVRKQRSLVDLTALNEKYGLPYRPPPAAAITPPTIYENLDILKDSASFTASAVTSETFTKKEGAFEKFLKSDSAAELYIRVSDCFD